MIRKKLKTQFEAKKISPSLLKVKIYVQVRNNDAKIWTQLLITWVGKQICNLREKKNRNKFQIQSNHRGTTTIAKNFFNQLNYFHQKSVKFRILSLTYINLTVSKNNQKMISFIKSCQNCKESQALIFRPSLLYLMLTQLYNTRNKSGMLKILLFHPLTSTMRPINNIDSDK